MAIRTRYYDGLGSLKSRRSQPLQLQPSAAGGGRASGAGVARLAAARLAGDWACRGGCSREAGGVSSPPRGANSSSLSSSLSAAVVAEEAEAEAVAEVVEAVLTEGEAEAAREGNGAGGCTSAARAARRPMHAV